MLREHYIIKRLADVVFSDKTALLSTFISILILLGSILLFLGFSGWHFSWILDEQIFALFGDFIGGVVGTLLAFAAAVLYYVALTEQRKDVENNRQSLLLQNQTLQQQIAEFRQQRAELEETRKVYEKQTQLMTEQSHIMKQQQFESSFYSMLRVYMDCKDHMDSKEVDCFRTWIDMIEKGLSNDCVDYAISDIFERHNMIVSLFENLYEEKRDVMAPYFKTVTRILSFIDNTTSLENKEKIQYVKFFRAQLSDCETFLLYYNLHSDFSGAARNISYKLNFLKHYDYLLSVDARHKHFMTLDQDRNLIQFLHQFDVFLIESINKCCDGFSEEEQTYEMAFYYKNIISDISSDPDIAINLRIPIKNEKLDNGFCSLFSDFVCDRVFLSQFSQKREKIELKELGEADNRRVYGCVIHSPYVLKMKTDNDYE